jgi:hypothetical protein
VNQPGNHTPDRRRFLQSLSALPALACARPALAEDAHLPFPSLSDVGPRFRVVIIADTQVGPADARGVVPATSQRNMSRIIDEVNAMDPAPAFVLFNGDQVENVEERKVDNFLHRASKLKPLSILVHGNHDGVHPYAEFVQMQKKLNGTSGIYFSWDAGNWHFATIPTNIPTDQYAKEVLDWLENDLLTHRDRPTIVFPHYHLMPQGLSQLEWYTYDRPFRLRCYDIFQKAGNVRYAIGGHVHNGIQTSLKTAWTYRGTNYMVAPTCTASRNFGEDFPPFAKGLPQSDQDAGGGYYLLLDFNGNDLAIRGKLVGQTQDFLFPSQFKEYTDQDPLWMRDLADLPLYSSLLNGSFDSKLARWYSPFRYIADQDPGFIARPDTPKGASQDALYLACREKGQHWARDEEVEAYQRFQPPPAEQPTLSARFMLGPHQRSGGGYIRLGLFRQRSLVMTILVDWLEGKKDRNTRMGINSLYTATGKRGVPDSFIKLGQDHQALFWTLQPQPNTWHQVQLDLPKLINQSLASDSAWNSLAPDEFLLALGVWSLEDPGSTASAWFDDLAWQPPIEHPIQCDGKPLPIDAQIFITDFGRETWNDRQKEKAKRRKTASQTTSSPPQVIT